MLLIGKNNKISRQLNNIYKNQKLILIEVGVFFWPKSNTLQAQLIVR